MEMGSANLFLPLPIFRDFLFHIFVIRYLFFILTMYFFDSLKLVSFVFLLTDCFRVPNDWDFLFFLTAVTALGWRRRRLGTDPRSCICWLGTITRGSTLACRLGTVTWARGWIWRARGRVSCPASLGWWRKNVALVPKKIFLMKWNKLVLIKFIKMTEHHLIWWCKTSNLH